MTIFRNFHQSEIAVSNYSFEPLFEELKIVIMDVLDLLLKQQQKKKKQPQVFERFPPQQFSCKSFSSFPFLLVELLSVIENDLYTI